MYWRVQVFGSEYVYHTACHLYDVALYHVLYYEVAFVGMEATDFESGGREKLPHMFAKEQNGGVLEFAILGEQTQIVQHVLGGGVGFFMIVLLWLPPRMKLSVRQNLQIRSKYKDLQSDNNVSCIANANIRCGRFINPTKPAIKFLTPPTI